MTDAERSGADPGTGPGELPGQPESDPALPPYPPYPVVPYPISQVVLPPSGSTATFAGVLAILGAIVGIPLCLMGIALMAPMDPYSSPSYNSWLPWVPTIGGLWEAITLSWGAVLLFRRNPGGRRLVAGGCVLHILLVGIMAGSLAIGMASDHDSIIIGSPSDDETGLLSFIPAGILLLAPAIVTLILVLTPATARWLGWGQLKRGAA